MSTGNTPRDEADFEAFLSRESPISADYASLEQVGPPASLDEKILGIAKVAAKLAVKPVVTPVGGKAAPTRPAAAAGASAAGSTATPNSAERRKRDRPPATAADEDDEIPPARRPPWLLPVALAASVLVAVGVGLGVFMSSPSDSTDATLDASQFAKRSRERSEESKAAAAAAAAEQDAEVIVLESAPLPPPPVFELEGPQVQDLDAAIALIRKELVLANQVLELQSRSNALAPASEAADSAAKMPDVAVQADPGIVQPRERRLTKILELYDGGNPELAGDSLEIFLRDFEDDPISKRIVALTP